MRKTALQGRGMIVVGSLQGGLSVQALSHPYGDMGVQATPPHCNIGATCPSQGSGPAPHKYVSKSAHAQGIKRLWRGPWRTCILKLTYAGKDAATCQCKLTNPSHSLLSKKKKKGVTGLLSVCCGMSSWISYIEACLFKREPPPW
jgi:hypothetical protein